MPGLLDTYQIQISNDAAPNRSPVHTIKSRHTYATAPQRRVRPRPSPRTQRIAGASAVRLSSQESLDYDRWLMKTYATKTAGIMSAEESSLTRSLYTDIPYDPANTTTRPTTDVAQDKNESTFLSVQPWQQSNTNANTNTNTSTSTSTSTNRTRTPLSVYDWREDPDRFGHVHAKEWQKQHPYTKKNIVALVPNSKAKKEVMTILAESVLSRKKHYNDLVIAREEHKRIRDLLNAQFLDKLDIRFRGLAFEALPFEEALGIQTVVDQRLHAHFHGLLCKYLFDMCGESDVTSLVEEVDLAFHPVSKIKQVPSDLEQLFRHSETTVDTIVLQFERSLMENRIRRETAYRSKLEYVLKRHREECRIARDNMNILEKIVYKSTEQLSDIQLEHEKSRKGIKQVNGEVDIKRKELRDERRAFKKRLEKSQQQVADDQQWQQELERIQARTVKVTKAAAAKSRTSAMKVVSKTQARKKTLLLAEQMYQDKRLGPYKVAADKIFKATGVDSVEKILSTFQDQSKKELLMSELTEEKEAEKADKTVLLGRLRKVLQRGMVAGVHVQHKNDGNIEGAEASLDHAAKSLLISTEKVVQREKLANSCKAGVLSLCFKLGIPENISGRHILESLDRLENVLVEMLEASYKTVGDSKYIAQTYVNSAQWARAGDEGRLDEWNVAAVVKQPQQMPPTSPMATTSQSNAHENIGNVQDHHPYETELRKKMISMEGSDSTLKSPCDSPNNIRISPTKKPQQNFTLNMHDGVLSVVKIRSTNYILQQEQEDELLKDEDLMESEGVNKDDENGEDKNKMDKMDVLPHLLTPSDLEGFLMDATGETITSPRELYTSPSPPAPPRNRLHNKQADNEFDKVRRVQKWSTMAIVQSYKKKLRRNLKDAQLAKQEGRFDDANFLETSPLPKLKTRTHTHQLTALHEALMKEQAEKEARTHTHHSHKKHHHKKHHKKKSGNSTGIHVTKT